MAIYLNRRVIFGIMFRVFMVLLLFKIGLSNYVPASFVFGDSLLDVGNNNYIVSLAKANHDPYGIDFGMATGRFSNGRTVADVISESLVFIRFFISLFKLLYRLLSLFFEHGVMCGTRSETGSWLFSSLLGSHYYWISGSKGCQLCLWCRWNS